MKTIISYSLLECSWNTMSPAVALLWHLNVSVTVPLKWQTSVHDYQTDRQPDRHQKSTWFLSVALLSPGDKNHINICSVWVLPTESKIWRQPLSNLKLHATTPIVCYDFWSDRKAIPAYGTLESTTTLGQGNPQECQRFASLVVDICHMTLTQTWIPCPCRKWCLIILFTLTIFI